jgi:endonuclease/exonuclease/phosphatase (EEP) superfamily protein YafD
MLTFLFWNTNRKPLSEVIATIAERESVDIVILAECNIDASVLLKTLNRKGTAFHFVAGRGTRITMLTRFAGRYLVPVFDGKSMAIHRLILPARQEILVASVHFPSKLHWRNESQMMECAVFGDAIADAERRVGHSRTVVVGDLNMNPFEEGVVGARGLHAVMSRKVAQRDSRIVQGRRYPFFYNPMWGHLGDWLERPVGSYYYESAQHVNYYWNTFDQVLLRPQLMDRFRSDQLKILDRAGDVSLAMESGRPDHGKGSDHFPLLFKLDI